LYLCSDLFHELFSLIHQLSLAQLLPFGKTRVDELSSGEWERGGEVARPGSSSSLAFLVEWP
jgi:hypothetical protein